MKQSDWQRAYEQAPTSFTGRMETTLAHLKEEEPMKKLSLRIVCIAAAAVLALMGTAIALTATGVLDTYTGIQPLPTAQSLVQKDFDQQGGENYLFTLTVREALCDGYRTRIVYEYRAKAADIFLYGLDFCSGDSVDIDGQEYTFEQLAAGRRPVRVSMPTPAGASDDSVNPVGGAADTADFLYESPGVLILWKEFAAVSSQDAQQYSYSYFPNGSESRVTEPLAFRIRNAAEIKEYAIPAFEGERFACRGGRLILSPLYTYMIVDVQLRQEIQNRDIWLCDAQGNRYEVASGSAATPDEQGFETYTSLLSPMEELPDTLQLLLSAYDPFEPLESIAFQPEAR